MCLWFESLTHCHFGKLNYIVGDFMYKMYRDEVDIKNEIIEKNVNGYDIIRSETKRKDNDGNFHGRTKVYYDVCDDVDCYGSFKTLKEAIKFCNELDSAER